MSIQKRFGRDDKSRRAESTLGSVMIHERLLYWVEFTVLHEGFNRGDGLALGLDSQHGAGINGPVVEQQGACSALAAIANALGSSDIEVVTQGVQQSYAGLDLKIMSLAID